MKTNDIIRMLDKKDVLSKELKRLKKELHGKDKVLAMKHLFISFFIITPLSCLFYYGFFSLFTNQTIPYLILFIHATFAIIYIFLTSSFEKKDNTRACFLIGTIPCFNIAFNCFFFIVILSCLDRSFFRALKNKKNIDEISKEIEYTKNEIAIINKNINSILDKNINDFHFLEKVKQDERMLKLTVQKIKKSIEDKGYLQTHQDNLMTIKNY